MEKNKQNTNKINHHRKGQTQRIHMSQLQHYVWYDIYKAMIHLDELNLWKRKDKKSTI